MSHAALCRDTFVRSIRSLDDSAALVKSTKINNGRRPTTGPTSTCLLSYDN